ncbi:cytochrome c-type biogenesis protein CcsB [Herbihabitans rhizosphaerae]|uniref:Cytochrome c-type biogenesis protein CcsB n=1 Tax=Herbihabitans rhizosphaerae TaxID=1872711 RepID=A0A4Q7L837_9PSEU|nr:c-type cytochrome biogenesis protein CcsB [Herbihabitans rhizosphaerae]RZS44542.1 cytochrome c-type biogenesis protein CcsB [Herbihabitans rhizosphaerae]
MVDETLATYGDWSHGAATFLYLMAMALHLVEYAFGRRSTLAVAEPARELATVGGGSSGTTITPGVVPTEQGPGRVERLGRMGVAVTVLGAVMHVASLVLRGVAAGRAPWGNMYEYGSLVCLVAVVTYLVLLYKFGARKLGVFILVPVTFLMFIGGTLLYAQAAPLQPSLRSYWLVVHVLAAAVASGVFMVPGVASVLYLIKARNEKRPDKMVKLAGKLPSKDLLDRVAYRTTVLAFPVFTFGVICGGIWAEAAWGRFWDWDPKETVALVCWVIYAAYLHARATAGWRGTPAAVINVVGFAGTVFNLFFVNLVTSGLHSYAGV